MADTIDQLTDNLKDALSDKLSPKKVLSERNLKKQRGAFMTCLIAAIILVLLVTVGAVYYNAIRVDLFETALLENVDYQTLGTDELSIRSFARETIFYLTDQQDSWNPQIVIGGFPASSFIPQTFRDHMATVKGWVSSATAVFLTGAGIVLVLLLRALSGAGKKGGFSLGGYYLGVLIPLVMIVGIGVWAWLDFNGLWATLHRVLIPDGIFDSTELVMQLFPASLFAAYIPHVLRTFGILMAAVLVLPLLLAPLSALVKKLSKATTATKTTKTTKARSAKKSTAKGK